MFRHSLTLLIALFLVALLSAQSSTDHLIGDKISSIPETKKIDSTNKYPSENTDNFKDIKVTGVVLDGDTKAPLEYATVSFYSHKEHKLTDGVITNTNGEFEIKVAKGNYDIKIEYISYKTVELKNVTVEKNMDLGVIELIIDFNVLSEYSPFED